MALQGPLSARIGMMRPVRGDVKGATCVPGGQLSSSLAFCAECSNRERQISQAGKTTE
jgi:hypothetical protein